MDWVGCSWGIRCSGLLLACCVPILDPSVGCSWMSSRKFLGSWSSILFVEMLWFGRHFVTIWKVVLPCIRQTLTMFALCVPCSLPSHLLDVLSPDCCAILSSLPGRMHISPSTPPMSIFINVLMILRGSLLGSFMIVPCIEAFCWLVDLPAGDFVCLVLGLLLYLSKHVDHICLAFFPSCISCWKCFGRLTEQRW